MAMVCPTCSTTHDQRLHCPACGARLVYRDSDRRHGGGRGGSWWQSPSARVFIGLLLAQGLYHGLQQLVAGLWLTATGVGFHEAAAGISGPTVTQALQLFGLLIGGLIAGSGQRSGPLLGVLVGVCNGVLCLALRPAGAALTTVSLYGQPLLQSAFGALAGWIGCVIWKPLPIPTLPGTFQTVRKPNPVRRLDLFAGPIAWLRVIIGTSLAIIGTVSASVILDAVLTASGGHLSTADRWHDQLLTWEIKVLAVLTGAGIAGANTHNGLKQGLCVAVPLGLLLVAFPVSRSQPTLTGLMLLSTFLLCLVGGWFGGQLLPPVVKTRRIGSLGPMM
jgi:hypothetical protein